MTKGQMHVFNWFFLLVIATVFVLHLLVTQSMLASGQIHKGVSASIYLFVGVFALIWLALYLIQIKSFGEKAGRMGIVLNGLLTGAWVIVYTFLNFGR